MRDSWRAASSPRRRSCRRVPPHLIELRGDNETVNRGDAEARRPFPDGGATASAVDSDRDEPPMQAPTNSVAFAMGDSLDPCRAKRGPPSRMADDHFPLPVSVLRASV